MSILNARRPPPASPLRPTWAWDFARYGRVPPGATYTGNSGNGTYVNSAGVITASTNNSPRFDYDPATLSPLGYLAEMASTNLLLRSDALDNASWTAQRASVSANATTSPDGTANADKLVEDSTAANNHRIISNTIALTNSGVAASIFAKAAERTAFRIEFAGGAGTFGSSFNLSTGAAVSTDANTTATIRAHGNGWYRCSVQATWPSASNCNVWLYMQAVAGTNSYNGDGSSGMYFWGGQCELGGVGLTSYIPTAGSTVTRAQDVLSLPLTSLPGWSATQGGVLVAAYRLHTINPASPGNEQVPLHMDDGGGTNNAILFGANNTGSGRRSRTFSGGAGQISVGTGISVASVFTRTKQSLGWSLTNGFEAADGTSTSSTTGSFALPIGMTTLNIGKFGATCLNGTLESIAYYRGARSDAFVQAVSR